MIVFDEITENFIANIDQFITDLLDTKFNINAKCIENNDKRLSCSIVLNGAHNIKIEQHFLLDIVDDYSSECSSDKKHKHFRIGGLFVIDIDTKKVISLTIHYIFDPHQKYHNSHYPKINSVDIYFITAMIWKVSKNISMDSLMESLIDPQMNLKFMCHVLDEITNAMLSY